MEKKTPKLRSDLPVSVAWGDRCALMRGLGFSNEDLKKPHIGIINTYSSMNPGHVHLNRLAAAVTEGVREAGGLPLQFNALNLCDGIVAPRSEYTLPSRDLLVNEVEVIVEANLLDGMVLLGTCDKIIPGLLMAAARLDLPAIMVTGGYMGQGYADGKPINYIDIGASVSEMLEGRRSMQSVMAVIDGACPAPGACDMMGTANTMALVSEALGMSLPGNGSIAASSLPLDEMAREAGRRIMELWRDGVTARQVITRKSIKNAVKVCMAVGGSTNSLVHIPAIADEAEIDLDVPDVFDQASFNIPLLVRVRPNGPHSICQMENAGGLRAVMNELRDHLDLDCLTVNLHTTGENIEGHAIRDTEVIRPIENSYQSQGGIAILRGNICPQGAAVKQSAVPESLMSFRGPARIFYHEQAACEALTSGAIRPGDAVVILFQGAKAGPGLASTANFTFQLAGSELSESICMITDGRFSGRFPRCGDRLRVAGGGHARPDRGCSGRRYHRL